MYYEIKVILFYFFWKNLIYSHNKREFKQNVVKISEDFEMITMILGMIFIDSGVFVDFGLIKHYPKIVLDVHVWVIIVRCVLNVGQY